MALGAVLLAGALAGAPDGARAATVTGNGAALTGSNATLGAHNFVIGTGFRTQCNASVSGPGLAGSASSTTFTITYTNCRTTLGGVPIPTTVTTAGGWSFNAAPASFTPSTGAWSGGQIVTNGVTTISLNGGACVITVPSGVVVGATGQNAPTGPGPYTGTRIDAFSSTIPFTTTPSCSFLTPPATYIGSVNVANAWAAP